jgi:glycosyltransferase involved in cell wall biosynthesis
VTRAGQLPEIVLLSSGHHALDHRIFDKEARTLARHFPVRVVAQHARDETRHGVEITALKPYHSRFDRFFRRPVSCYLAARGPGPRVVILCDAELLVWAPVARALGWRVIYDAHEDFSRLMLRRTWIPGALRGAVGRLDVVEKQLAAACDGVIAATEALVENFDHPNRLAVHNLPTREFLATARSTSLPMGERQFDVVHLGTLSDERLDFLISVLRAMLELRPAATALVLGLTDAQARRMRAEFSTASVTVIGKVSYARIPLFLGTCRIGLDVHPVLYPHLLCAVPVKVFEYMANGAAVVTSYLPELHRLLGAEGARHVVTVTEPEPAAYAAELDRLLGDPGRLAETQTALLGLVGDRWNWSAEEEGLVRFVSEIAALNGAAT